jgi:antitoxin ParD1/3/4
MPTRNISLTPEQDAFVESVVKAGEYQNASAAVRDALRALQQRRREDALKLKALRMQIKAGVDALERGEFAEVDDVDLDSHLESLAVESSTGALIPMARFRLSRLAREDLAHILATSGERWGTEGRRRYAAMIAMAMRQARDPDGVATRNRSEICAAFAAFTSATPVPMTWR